MPNANQSRRSFLSTSSSILGAVTILPTLDDLRFGSFGLMSPRSSSKPRGGPLALNNVERQAFRQLLTPHCGAVAFAAEAQSALEWEFLELYAIGVGILTILEFFGLDWPHLRAKFVAYQNAGASIDGFKQREQLYRKSGATDFIGVHRDRNNTAVLAAFDEEGQGMSISTQHGGLNVVDLSGPAPGLICCARDLLLRRGVPAEEAVTVAAVSEANPFVTDTAGYRIQFANGGFLLHHPESGRMILHFPPHTDLNRVESLMFGTIRRF